MIGSLAALAVAATAVPSASPPRAGDDPDLHCVAAVSNVLGAASDHKAIDAEGLTGLTAVFMYFLGKVDGRRPGLDLSRELTALMNAPGYERQLPLDMVRCGKEAETRGALLQQLGEDLKRSTPLTASRPG